MQGGSLSFSRPGAEDWEMGIQDLKEEWTPQGPVNPQLPRHILGQQNSRLLQHPQPLHPPSPPPPTHTLDSPSDPSPPTGLTHGGAQAPVELQDRSLGQDILQAGWCDSMGATAILGSNPFPETDRS